MTIIHGGNIQEISEHYQLNPNTITDFSANINPLGFPKGIKELINSQLTKMCHYPDLRYKDLIQQIATFHECATQNIYVANGAIEAIYNFSEAAGLKHVLILAPTFMEYERAFKKYHTKVSYFKTESFDFAVCTDDLLKSAEELKVDGICICNPNNPTGKMLSKKELLNILAFSQSKRISLIIDEAFMDFVEKEESASLVGHLDAYQHLYIFRSLTKLFAIPGLRLGYLLTVDEALMAKLQQGSIPWRVNIFADLAGQSALKDQKFISETIDYVTSERSFLISELKRFSQIIVYTSRTNFIFFKLWEKFNLQEKLLARGFLIRDCQSFKGLTANYYRIAVRTREENRQLVAALKEILWQEK